MQIGIIDTGADKTHKRLQSASINGVSFKYEGDKVILIEGEYYHDSYGHGTSITSILNRHCPFADFFVVKVFDESTKKIEINFLVNGLKYLLEKTSVKIINISLGVQTEETLHELSLLISKAKKKGVIIIASAYHNPDLLCYPANFEYVLSVGSGYVKKKDQFKFLGLNSHTDIIGKGGFQRVPIPGGGFKFVVGTSYATAHISGIIAKAYSEKKWNNHKSLLLFLKAESNEDILGVVKSNRASSSLIVEQKNNFLKKQDFLTFLKQYKPTIKTERIALFPIDDKEVLSVFENKKFSKFSFQLLIGFPKILKQTQDSINRKYIRRRLSNEEYNLFDTIVIGYFLDSQDDLNSVFGINLIKKCIFLQKNFIIWDKTIYNYVLEISSKNKDFKGKVFFVSYEKEDMVDLYTKLSTSFNNEKPSLCVIGTSKKQGKFTVQLKIKDILSAEGYKVSHISTEPQGILLGSDFVFPIGHKGTVYPKSDEWFHILNSIKTSIINYSNPDVFITGSQSGIVPRHPVYTGLPPTKLLYVNAFYPDGLVCTISPDDTIEFINRTVNVVSSYSNAKVLFYCLTPYKLEVVSKKNNSQVKMIKLDKLSFLKRLKYYSEKLDKPVFDIMDDSNSSEIFKIIIKHYSNNEN